MRERRSDKVLLKYYFGAFGGDYLGKTTENHRDIGNWRRAFVLVTGDRSLG